MKEQQVVLMKEKKGDYIYAIVGPFNTREEAQIWCNKLKSQEFYLSIIPLSKPEEIEDE